MFTSFLRRCLHVSYRDIHRKEKSVYFISLCFLIEQIWKREKEKETGARRRVCAHARERGTMLTHHAVKSRSRRSYIRVKCRSIRIDENGRKRMQNEMNSNAFTGKQSLDWQWMRANGGRSYAVAGRTDYSSLLMPPVFHHGLNAVMTFRILVESAIDNVITPICEHHSTFLYFCQDKCKVYFLKSCIKKKIALNKLELLCFNDWNVILRADGYERNRSFL